MGFCRKPKTTSELRSHCGYETDREYEEYYVPSVRGSRRNLPTWYDDLITITEKNWKRHRKTQWKPKEEEKVKKHSKFRGHVNIKLQAIYKTKHVWAWDWCLIGREWNPDKWEYSYCFGKQKGCWEDVCGWRWRGKQSYITFYEGESKEIRSPIIKYWSETKEPYFDGWETIIK